MPKLSDFQAILFDIDRTLIPPSREIYPEVTHMLQTLHENKITIGVCSGRGYASIKNAILPLFPEESVHVLAGGALVITTVGQVLWEHSIPAETLKELKSVIRKSDCAAIFMKPDAQYAEGEVLMGIQNHPWNQVGKDLETMSDEGVGLVYIARPSNAIKSFVHNNPQLAYKDLISNSEYQYYDITAAGVTKALAVQQWSKQTGIPVEKIIGVGDSANDLEFLQACGYAVAMGNADQEIKAIADKIIGDVTQKGLPNFVQDILEGAEL